MPSAFPAAIDAPDNDFVNGTDADAGAPGDLAEGKHALAHNSIADAIVAIQETLGVDPQAGFDSVGDRIAALPGATALIHQVTVAPTGTPADFNTDGVDDHLTIEAAIAALPASGGLVCLRSGEYTLGRALRPSTPNVTLWGEGANTSLKLAGTADDNVVTVSAANIWLKQMKIDGNRGVIDVDHHGVSFITGADECGLRDVWITETVHHGTQSSNATNLTLDNVLVTNTGKVGSNRDGAGIVLGGGQGPLIGAKVVNCRVFNTGYHGFQVYRGSQHIQILNCSAAQVGQTRDTGNSMEIHPGTLDVHVSHFVGIGTASGANGAGIVVDSEAGTAAAKGVTLHSCWIEGHALNGITNNGANDVTVSGCHIKNNGRTGSSSNKFGIRLKNGTAGDVATNCHIFGNFIYDDQAGGSKTQNNPIGVYDGATNVNIFGNTFYGHLVADTVLIDGTSTGVVNKFLNTGDGGLTVAGDLSGSLLAPTVAKLRGKNLPAPTATEDQKTFIYDHATGAYIWTAIASDVAVTALKARSHRKVHTDIVSLFGDWMNLVSNTTVTTANNMFGYVMRVPKTGTLRDILLHVNAPSGNVAVSVYSVAAGSGTRTRLYSSGSVACPAQGWNIIGDPALAVTEGDLIALCFSCDNAVATFGRYNAFVGSASAVVPAAFAPEGDVRMSCLKAAAFPDAGATWTTPGLTTVPFGIVARVA